MAVERFWEYRVERVKTGRSNLDNITDEWLNRFGRGGWELVEIVPLPKAGGVVEQVYLYFKRLVTRR